MFGPDERRRRQRQQTCRVCLGPASAGAVSLLAYAARFKRLLDVEILDDDAEPPRPEVMCARCARNAQVAFDFLDEFRRAQTHFTALAAPAIETAIKEEPVGAPTEPFELRAPKPESCEGDDADRFAEENGATEENGDDDASCDGSFEPESESKERLRCGLCAAAPAEFDSIKALRAHFRAHAGKKSPACPACAEPFKLRSRAIDHMMRRHSNAGRPYACDSCAARFYALGELNAHRKNKHDVDKLRFACPYCPKRFPQRSWLDYHTPTHTNERRFACERCGKRFKTRNTLKKHALVHDARGRHECGECGMKFKTKYTLAGHAVQHAADRSPKICDRCGLGCTTRGNLKKHIEVVHSAEGACVVCFARVPNVHEHMATAHAGERPFECDDCGKRFSSRRALSIHISNHLSEGRFPCTAGGCARTFRMRSMLTFHLQKCHDAGALFRCDECARPFFRLNDFRKHANTAHRGRV